MITWAQIQTWNEAALADGSRHAQHRAAQLGQVAHDLDRAGNSIQSQGETADAARAAARGHAGTARTLQQQATALQHALNGAATAVVGLNREVSSCRLFASACGLIIAPNGAVSIGPTVRAQAAAQAVAMRLPNYTATPAWIKGQFDKANLTGKIHSAVWTANTINETLEAGITAAKTTGSISAQSLDLSAELGGSGQNASKQVRLPLNPDDYWNPPTVKHERNFPTTMGENETFPPKGTTLAPNTAYSVFQDDDGKSILRGIYYTDEHGTVTHVQSNVSREKDGPLNFDLRRPAPNTVYQVVHADAEGTTTYVTDELSRTKTTYIDNLNDEKGARHSGIQSSMGHLGSYRDGDKSTGHKVYDYNGGHIEAAQFGGIREEINYSPQLATVNQSNSVADARVNGPNYGRIENMWSADQAADKQVDAVIHHVFDQAVQERYRLVEQVPTAYLVQYATDNKVSSTFVLDNTPPRPR